MCRPMLTLMTYLPKKCELKSSVRFDKINQILGPETAEKVANMRTNEAVVHDCGAIILTRKILQVN